MTCQKAFEIDLAAFVVDGDDEAWASFRDHYPRCRDCSAEVRVWAELQASLRSGAPSEAAVHLAKDLLLKYEEQRHTLSTAERSVVENHLRTCRSCPEELAVLRAFDFSRIKRSVPVRPHPFRTYMVDLLAQLRAVALHPAFAYALLLLVLYPAFIRDYLTVHPEASRLASDERVALAGPRRGADTPPQSSRRVLPEDAAARSDRPIPAPTAAMMLAENGAPEPPRPGQGAAEVRQATSAATEPPPSQMQRRPPTTREQMVARAPGSAPVGVPAAPPADVRDERREQPDEAAQRALASAAEQQRETEPLPAPTGGERDALLARAAEPPAEDAAEERPNGGRWRKLFGFVRPDRAGKEPHALGFSKGGDALLSGGAAPETRGAPDRSAAGAATTAKGAAATPAPWLTVVLKPGERVEAARGGLGVGLLLRLVSETLGEGGQTVAVRVVAPNGHATEYEVVPSAPPDPHVDVHIPAAQLSAGTYRIQTRLPAGPSPPRTIPESTLVLR